MTDQELLHLAAKAVGLRIWCGSDGPRLLDDGVATYQWNPLTDDGDALRLLAAITSLWSLKLMFGQRVDIFVAWGTGAGIQVSASLNDGSTAAAIRRAIVLAAAEVGRNVESRL